MGCRFGNVHQSSRLPSLCSSYQQSRVSKASRGQFTHYAAFVWGKYVLIHFCPFSSIVTCSEATIIQHEVMRRVFQESLGICKQRKQQRYAINGVEKPNTNAKYINRSKSTLRWPTRKLTRRSSRSAFSFQIPSTSTSSHTSPVRQLDSTCPSLALGCRSC